MLCSNVDSVLPPILPSSSSFVNPQNDSLCKSTMIPDSGASDHYIAEADVSLCNDVRNNAGPTVTLPDATTLTATKTAVLPLPNELQTLAKTGHVLPKLNSTLLSLGKFCDAGCTVHLNEKHININNNDRTILTGWRTPHNGLWEIPFHPTQKTTLQHNNVVLPLSHPNIYPTRVAKSVTARLRKKKYRKTRPPFCTEFSSLDDLIDINVCNTLVDNQLKCDRTASRRPANALNVIIHKNKTKSDLAKYHHGSCGWPVSSTFIKAIENNHFTTWPGLDPQLIKKHLPPSIATNKGHMHQERQGLQSTSNIPNIKKKLENIKLNAPGLSLQEAILKDIALDFHPKSDQPNERSNCVIYTIYECNPTNMGYTDLTGRFPYRSSRGNEYIFIAYNYDGNAILAKAIRNRTAAIITEAWKTLHDTFVIGGVAPSTYVLDNEISSTLKAAFQQNEVSFQLVPPNNHRANAAERAIRTFKEHFKAILAGVDHKFPLS